MRLLWIVLLLTATFPLGGCEEAAGGIASIGVWLGGLILVVVIWVAAYIVIKLRSS